MLAQSPRGDHRWSQRGLPQSASWSAVPAVAGPGAADEPTTTITAKASSQNWTTIQRRSVHQRSLPYWLATHPRVHLHFTPTYASWLNLVEVFFSIIERQALRRGDFASVAELLTAIRRFCDGWNQRCQPFTWTKDADQILAKLNRQNTSATDH